MSSSTKNLALIIAEGVEKFSRAIITGNFEKIDKDVDRVNKFGTGMVRKSKNNEESPGIVGAFVIADNISAVPFKAGRHYELEYLFKLTSPGTNMPIGIEFRRMAGNITVSQGTVIDYPRTVFTPPGANLGGTYSVKVHFDPTADETLNVFTQIQRVLGTNGFTLSDRTLVVRDLGAQF